MTSCYPKRYEFQRMDLALKSGSPYHPYHRSGVESLSETGINSIFGDLADGFKPLQDLLFDPDINVE